MKTKPNYLRIPSFQGEEYDNSAQAQDPVLSWPIDHTSQQVLRRWLDGATAGVSGGGLGGLLPGQVAFGSSTGTITGISDFTFSQVLDKLSLLAGYLTSNTLCLSGGGLTAELSIGDDTLYIRAGAANQGISAETANTSASGDVGHYVVSLGKSANNDKYGRFKIRYPITGDLLTFDLALTDDRTATWPDKSGTIAYLDDIVASAIFPASDSVAIIKDNASDTKRMRFEASGITAGQTRVLTAQDSDGTIAYLTDIPAGTLSNGNFIDDETPTGTIDGSNVTFTLAEPPSPAQALLVFLNGQFQAQGSDYTLASNTITFTTAPAADLAGLPFKAFYRV